MPRDDSFCTQRKIFWILINQPEIRLSLPFSDSFGIKRTSVWIQINQKLVNTIWIRVDSTRFRKYSSVCSFWSAASKQFETRRILFPFPFKFGIIWSYWHFSYCIETKRNYVSLQFLKSDVHTYPAPLPKKLYSDF